MPKSIKYIELSTAPSLKKVLQAMKKHPDLKGVYMSQSTYSRTRKIVFDLLEVSNIKVMMIKPTKGRPSFKVSLVVIEMSQSLKDKGLSMNEIAKKLYIPESTFYKHIWNKLK